MYKFFLFVLFIGLLFNSKAQSVEIQYDYNSMGDCIFGAYNNSPAPLFLQLNFADLENTTFPEPLPYVKQLEPGFTNLFTLLRDPDAGVPRFNYELKVFRSNPLAKIDLKFPYLIPFEPGKDVTIFDVEAIDGFWGSQGLDSWSATGFFAKAGDKVFAIRNGIVVEIAGQTRSGEPTNWYNTWTNALTVLQPDGSLLCYHNLQTDKTLKVGEKIFAGQPIGKVVHGENSLTLLMYYESMFSKFPVFIIPQFVTGIESKGILISTTQYSVVHPPEIRGLEMSKKERRKILGKMK